MLDVTNQLVSFASREEPAATGWLGLVNKLGDDKAVMFYELTFLLDGTQQWQSPCF